MKLVLCWGFWGKSPRRCGMGYQPSVAETEWWFRFSTMVVDSIDRLRECAQIVPEAVEVAIAEEGLHLGVGVLPDGDGLVAEQSSPLRGQRHQTAAAVAAGSVVILTRARRSRGLRAAVKVVRSIASSDATAAMAGGFGRFRDIMSENCARLSGRGGGSRVIELGVPAPLPLAADEDRRQGVANRERFVSKEGFATVDMDELY